MHYYRTDLRALLVQGPDAAVFLGGLISQRTDLAPGEGSYGALLTPQGKLVTDFPLMAPRDMRHMGGGDDMKGALILGLRALEAPHILKRLSMFKLRSDVELQLLPDVLIGSAFSDGSGFIYQDSRHPKLKHALLRQDGLVRDGGTPEQFHIERAKRGIPEGAYDLKIGTSTLLDEGLACAIDWDKGCYMGQEVTARMRYRALIKRVLVPFKGIGVPGQVLTYKGKKIGEIRSQYDGCGFAYIRKGYAGQEIDGISLGRPMGLEQFANLYEANENSEPTNKPVNQRNPRKPTGQ